MTTLTPRQHQVVSLIGAGMPYKGVAYALQLSIVTVKYHAKLAAHRLPKPHLSTQARIRDWWQGHHDSTVTASLHQV